MIATVLLWLIGLLLVAVLAAMVWAGWVAASVERYWGRK